MNKQTYLEKHSLEQLRSASIISSEEVAFWAGDILVAENVITNEKRTIHEGARLLKESSRPSLLKG